MAYTPGESWVARPAILATTEEEMVVTPRSVRNGACPGPECSRLVPRVEPEAVGAEVEGDRSVIGHSLIGGGVDQRSVATPVGRRGGGPVPVEGVDADQRGHSPLPRSDAV